MSAFWVYVRIQAMIFVFGIVGPIFLIGYFLFQPDPTLRWMYWWGLFITFADILIALSLTEQALRDKEQQPRVDLTHQMHVVSVMFGRRARAGTDDGTDGDS